MTTPSEQNTLKIVIIVVMTFGYHLKSFTHVEADGLEVIVNSGLTTLMIYKLGLQFKIIFKEQQKHNWNASHRLDLLIVTEKQRFTIKFKARHGSTTSSLE